MKNTTGEDAHIIFFIKEDSVHASPFFISSSMEQNFTLPPHTGGRFIPFSVGMGSWTPRFIRSVADDLEAMEIHWNRGQIRLEGEDEIFNYFMARRKGLSNTRVLIQIGQTSSP